MQSQERELIAGLFGRLQPVRIPAARSRGRGADQGFRRRASRRRPICWCRPCWCRSRRSRPPRSASPNSRPRRALRPPPLAFWAARPRSDPGDHQHRRPRRRRRAPATRSPLAGGAVAPQSGGGSFLRSAMATARRRRRRRAAVRGHPQSDGQQSRPVRLGRGGSPAVAAAAAG